MRYIFGNDGNNTLVGTSASEMIYGFGGNDTIRSGGGADFIYGGEGSDTLDASGATGSMYASLGVLNNAGTEGYVYIESTKLYIMTDSIENFTGGAYDDGIVGSSAANLLRGGGGTDSLSGLNGNDVLVGDKGVDWLHGGRGLDIFRYSAGDAGNGTYEQSDKIGDFSRAEGDRIDLSAIDARFNVGGNQAFQFIGTADLVANRPGTVNYRQFGDDAIVSYNTDNDAAAEGQIYLFYVNGVNAGDFVL